MLLQNVGLHIFSFKYFYFTWDWQMNPSWSPPSLPLFFPSLSLSISPFRDLRSIYIQTAFQEYTYPLKFWWLNSSHQFYFLETPLWVPLLFTVWAGAHQAYCTVWASRGFEFPVQQIIHTHACTQEHRDIILKFQVHGAQET